MKARRKKAVGLVAGSAALVSAQFATPTPAGATPLDDDSGTQVDFSLSNDFAASGHTLCVPGGGCGVNQGGMVTAWQRYLYADGYLNSCGSTGVDGYYGNVTAFANGAWEADFAPAGTPADGVAANWSVVGARTLLEGGPIWRYSGQAWSIRFNQPGGNGAPYKIDLGSNGSHPTDHPDRGSYPYC